MSLSLSIGHLGIGSGARRGGGGGPWYEGLITPAHRWDARAAATATPADLVGSANMTVGAGSPTYSATGWGVGGLPVVQIGLAGFLTASTTVASGDDTPVTVSMSFLNANSSSGRFLTFDNTANQYQMSLHCNNGSSNYSVDRRITTYLAADTGVAFDANRHVLTYAFYGTTVTAYLDGTRVINAASLNTGALTLTAITVGGWNRSGGLVNPCPVDMGEVIVAAAALADTGPLAAFHAAHLAQWPLS